MSYKLNYLKEIVLLHCIHIDNIKNKMFLPTSATNRLIDSLKLKFWIRSILYIKVYLIMQKL